MHSSTRRWVHDTDHPTVQPSLSPIQKCLLPLPASKVMPMWSEINFLGRQQLNAPTDHLLYHLQCGMVTCRASPQSPSTVRLVGSMTPIILLQPSVLMTNKRRVLCVATSRSFALPRQAAAQGTYKAPGVSLAVWCGVSTCMSAPRHYNHQTSSCNEYLQLCCF